ncbi:hypothetical protein NIES2100_04060 [Calothrix sp. NIES-2100]|uniref:DUF4126 domain-containing protein n=1 Tax=Calothrix sp. NIES-2100 TaxID=1954172 RepID=UPI000B6061B3|nr:hypothetical protein NIES2100_04060 [Calothrix sp. NIES-2100]
MIEILATLSASGAVGIRIGIPLLILGFLHGGMLWSKVPILSHISPPVLLGFFTIWSLFELVASKKRLGQRVLQIFELLLSPIVGAIMGLAVSSTATSPHWLIAFIGGLLALVFQLVQVGWFYRLRGLPLWAVFLQDFLCVVLIIFAVHAPWPGGLITFILLWFAIRSAKQWYDWYWEYRHRQSKARS